MNACVNLPRVKQEFSTATAKHVVEIRHNDGIYRHLYAHNPESFCAWFEIITVPGLLIFNGDHGCYAFSRTNDMFEFFRNCHPNPEYWYEKILDGRDRVLKFSASEVVKHLKDPFLDFYKENSSIWSEEEKDEYFEEFAEEILSKGFFEETYKDLDYIELESGFVFDPTEIDPRIFTDQFLFACCAIPWAISKYDETLSAAKGVES